MEISDIVSRLSAKGFTVATAESCTGGMIASTIVDVPGASDCFNEGYVTYSNEAKMKNLGVKDSTLMVHGAVSVETVTEMAKGVRKKASADFGISSSGIAGPGGGSPQKPVGLVYVGVCDEKGVRSHELRFDSCLSRDEIRNRTAEFVFTIFSDSE